MVTTVTPRAGPVLTEIQAKTLDTLKSIAQSGREGIQQTGSQAANSARIKLPGLLLAAGSAAATGDIRSAQRVARETRILANSLRSGLSDDAAAAADGGDAFKKALSTDQATTIYKQLKLATVRAKIALVQPYGQPVDPSAKRAAEADIRETERSLAQLEAQLRGTKPKSGLDIRV